MTPSETLNAALAAARAAEPEIKHYYRYGVDVQLKADASPVTVADVEAERIIKGTLAKHFPEHGFYGEETGRERADADDLWLVDPIDGTKSFVRGYPFFSTQIALRHRGELTVGVSNAPEFGELAYAERGAGAVMLDADGERRLAVSEIRHIEGATLSFGNLASLAADARWSALGELVRRANRTRGYGDFYHYHLLAGGKIDIVIESDVNILDIAALTVVVREAGGVVTDLEGNDIDLDTTSVLAAGPSLHGQVLELLNASKR